MKREVILFNWRNTNDVSSASSYSRLLKEVLEQKEYVVKEVFLRTTKNTAPNYHEIHGPFDISTEDSKVLSWKKIDRRFAGFCRERFNIFVNTILIITDIKMLTHVNTFMFKECKILLVGSSDHILLENEDLLSMAQSNIFFKENVDATITGHRDDYNLHRLVFDGNHTNNFLAATSYFDLKEPRTNKNKDIILFYGHWEKKYDLAKLNALAESINKKIVFYSDGSRFTKAWKKRDRYPNIKFASIKNDVKQYWDRALFITSTETNNVCQPLVEAMAHGIPTIMFTKTKYNKKFVGEVNERGMFVDLNLGFTMKQKEMITKEDDYFAMSERCIDFVKRKFDRRSFEDNIDIVIRRLK